MYRRKTEQPRAQQPGLLERRRGALTAGLAACVVAAAAALPGAAGARNTSPSATAAKAGSTLTLAASTDPVSLNPALQNVDPVDQWYIDLAYDSLTRINGNGKVVPNLATSWKFANGDKTFVLTLRKGVQFSNGQRMTATSVVGSLKYVIKHGVNGPNWLSSVKKVQAVGINRVKISLKVPNSSMPYLLAQRLFLGAVISPQGVAKPNLLKRETLGAGPYMLDASATVPNNSYVFVPNPHYWNKKNVHYQKVIIKVIPSVPSELAAVAAGSVDIMLGDATTGRAAQKQHLGIVAPPSVIDGITFGDRAGSVVPALAKPQVRAALAYAINRKGIAKTVYGSFATGSATMTVPGFAGYSRAQAKAFSYNPKKAKRLLAAAGYPHGFKFNIATTTFDDANVMAQAVVANWASIGVKAHLTTFTNNAQIISAILGHKYPVTVYDYGALPMFIQAQSFYNGGKNQYNPWNSRNAKLNKLLAAGASARTNKAANKAYVKALGYAQGKLAWTTNVYAIAAPIIYNKSTVRGVEASSSNPTPNPGWTVRPAK